MGSCFIANLVLLLSYGAIALNSEAVNFSVDVTQNCSFVLHFDNVPWVYGGVGSLTINGEKQDLKLLSLSKGKILHQVFGDSNYTCCKWTHYQPNQVPDKLFETCIWTHHQNSTIMFEQRFPNELQNTNTSVPNGTWTEKHGPVSHDVTPFAEFPMIDMTKGAIAGSSFLLWKGGLQYHSTLSRQVIKGKGFDSHLAGLDYGPMVLFNESGEQFPSLIIAPASNIKLGAMSLTGDGCLWKSNSSDHSCTWSHGPSGELTFVEEGFTHMTSMTLGYGIRSSLFAWGGNLLKLHNTTRMQDDTLEKLGAFTDNGAFYDAGYWSRENNTEPDASAVLAAWGNALTEQQLPIKYIQLDDWWYVGGDTVEGVVQCTKSFTPLLYNTTDGKQKQLFPEGLSPLTKQFGGGLMLYMVNFCASNDYLKEDESVRSFVDPKGRFFLMPKGNTSEIAYGRILDEGIKQGMTLFEIDFMQQNFDEVPYYRTNPHTAEQWLQGLSDAAVTRGIVMQLCTATPRDAIASALLPAVTQMRASVDFACWCSSEPTSGNWDVGGQTLLLSSLRLGSSKDTFFSQDNQTGINHEQCSKCPVPTHHAELDVFMATLSRGPIGLGDGIHNTNKTLVMRTCTENGTILAPQYALTPIDATWATGRHPPTIDDKAAAAVWSAHTEFGLLVWHFVFGLDVPTSFPLLGKDLWPPIKSTAFVSRGWHAPPCRNGSTVASCGVVIGTMPDMKTGLPPSDLPLGTHFWELTTIAPVTDGGIALLGELDKIVHVSPARFNAISEMRGGLYIKLAGAPQEVVRLYFAVNLQEHNSGYIVVKTVTLSSDGVASTEMVT
eukprot:m.347079 g.347079  ORF g.347079 m.347079 type:complete len:830 (+) comp31229_c0_seq1:119-2608(+)